MCMQSYNEGEEQKWGTFLTANTIYTLVGSESGWLYGSGIWTSWQFYVMILRASRLIAHKILNILVQKFSLYTMNS